MINGMIKSVAVAGAILLSGAQATLAQQQTAIFAGGCFWCVESDFESIPGVINAETGFIGGSANTAKYKAVSKGGTGHYEAVRIVFDPKKVSYDALLHKFWRTVDPTDAGGQFCDRGDSYRTAVFATSGAQNRTAQSSKFAAQSALGQKIVTPVLKAGTFFPADEFHQDYYKSSKKVITRFGVVQRKVAYKKYRKACGRDARVKQLWGAQAGKLGS
jgi:peptide-methionine (S)-S-oxide reductase